MCECASACGVLFSALWIFMISSLTDPFTEIWLVIKVLSLLNVCTLSQHRHRNENRNVSFGIVNICVCSGCIYGVKVFCSSVLVEWVYLNFILITRIIWIENFVNAGYCVIFVCLHRESQHGNSNYCCVKMSFCLLNHVCKMEEISISQYSWRNMMHRSHEFDHSRGFKLFIVWCLYNSVLANQMYFEWLVVIYSIL